MGCSSSSPVVVTEAEKRGEPGAAATGTVEGSRLGKDEHVGLVAELLLGMLSRMVSAIMLHKDAFQHVADGRGLSDYGATVGLGAFRPALVEFDCEPGAPGAAGSAEDGPTQAISSWVVAAQQSSVRGGRGQEMLRAVHGAAVSSVAEIGESLAWCESAGERELKETLVFFRRAVGVLIDVDKLNVGEFHSRIDSFTAE